MSNAGVSQMSDTSTTTDDEEENDILVKRGELFKWTNYLSGWQCRYVIIERGTLAYYKSESEMDFGCRGLVQLDKIDIITHDYDPPRFDLLLSDGTSWYFRAETEEEKNCWIELLEDAKSDVLSGRVQRASSISIGSRSLHSSSSQRKTAASVERKIEELKTYREILVGQIDSLQDYFEEMGNRDAQENGVTEKIDGKNMVDFKGEAITFKATTLGVLSTLQHCLDLMSTETESWKRKLNKATKHKESLAKQLAIASQPDLEGPNRPITEEEFFDAVEEVLDKRDQLEKELNENSRLKSQVRIPTEHHIHSVALDFKIRDHLETTIAPAAKGETGSWELFCEDGEMKLFTREVEIEGGVCVDPLRAVHVVDNITAKEICTRFWDTEVRLEWELTIETCRVCEVLSDRDVVLYQTHKRVWPAAQRDVCYVSGLREIRLDKIAYKEPELERFGELKNCWLVINYSVDHQSAKLAPGMVRATVDVAMICRTYVRHGVKNPKRSDIKTSIVYTATINPGGWVPKKALRTVYRREYPRFLRTFTQYVAKKEQDLSLNL